jgi:hypothetical protein
MFLLKLVFNHQRKSVYSRRCHKAQMIILGSAPENDVCA